MGARNRSRWQRVKAGQQWEASGLAALAGPGPLERDYPARIHALLDPLNARRARLRLPPLDFRLFTMRAHAMALKWRGDTSANGSCLMLTARDGTIALNLARDEDREMLPALFESDVPMTADTMRALAVERSAVDLIERGRLLSLPVARFEEAAATPLEKARDVGPRGQARPSPLVVNLASLWAGPLCARLLGDMGARVISVEAVQRPDRSRRSCASLFDYLHAGCDRLVLDFEDGVDIARLRALLMSADVVIEGSRPAALERKGIFAREIVAGGEGRVWVSITAYGRTGQSGTRVGFGDDAAVATGLCSRDRGGRPCFIGDAIADPLTGIAAANAVLDARDGGGGVLLDVPLAGAAAFVASAPLLALREVAA